MAALRTRGPSSDNRKGAPQPFNPLLAGPAIADYYSMSTVLFSDVVGFTAWSSSVQPETVFQVLETMFGEFDALTAKFKVYKIETVREGGERDSIEACKLCACKGLSNPQQCTLYVVQPDTWTHYEPCNAYA